jgi:hypothetical protein
MGAWKPVHQVSSSIWCSPSQGVLGRHSSPVGLPDPLRCALRVTSQASPGLCQGDSPLYCPLEQRPSPLCGFRASPCVAVARIRPTPTMLPMLPPDSVHTRNIVMRTLNGLKQT